MTKLITTANDKKPHLRYLDGLRGIAALYVVLVHIEPLVGELGEQKRRETTQQVYTIRRLYCGQF